MSDIMGIFHGRLLCIEVKTGNAKQTKDQKNWENMINTMGGIYIVGRSGDQVVKELRRMF